MMFLNITIRLSWSIWHMRHASKDRNNWIPQLQNKKTIWSQSSVQRHNFRFCWTVWTAVCFLHIQLVGTNVWLPNVHSIPPKVNFESSKSPAKSEYRNSPNLHCVATLPTWQFCSFQHVWWMKSIDRVPRTFASFFGFFVKFWFCTDMSGSIGSSSCFTTAYRLLFRDSQLSLRTLWSAVIKSPPKFVARSTASPLRLLHGALVILVRLHISQFRSLGKWVWTLCLPKSSRLIAIGTRGFTNRTGVRASLWWNFVIHQIFAEFLQSFRNLRIITQVSPFDRGLFFDGFGIFVGLGFHRFTRSIISQIRHWQT